MFKSYINFALSEKHARWEDYSELLIVDDGSNKKWFKDTIDWHSIGINSVLTARNGIEALKSLTMKHPISSLLISECPVWTVWS